MPNSFNVIISDLILEISQLNCFRDSAKNYGNLPERDEVKSMLQQLMEIKEEDKELAFKAKDMMLAMHDAYGFECEGGCPAHTIAREVDTFYADKQDV